MKCRCCGETMILKRFYDYGGYDWLWECRGCGEIRNQTSAENRRGEGPGQWERAKREETATIQG
jgi:uncharacterized Zn finger protein